MGHDGFGGGVLQDKGGFVPLVGGVDRNADRPQQGQAEPAVKKLRAIGQQEAYPVAAADAPFLKHPGGLPRPVVELPVSQRRAGDFDKGFIRIALGRPFQKLP